MPRMVDYAQALQQLESQGLVCNYHNSGAFAFAPGVTQHICGWIGREDSTIRPEMRPRTLQINPLAMPALAGRVWQTFPGPAWIMPMSHWAFELEFGSRDWLAGLLRQIGIDAQRLRRLNNAAPIEFDSGEVQPVTSLLDGLLQTLDGSDFILALPGRPILCTVHHHRQLWWVSSQADVIARIGALAVEQSNQSQPPLSGSTQEPPLHSCQE